MQTLNKLLVGILGLAVTAGSLLPETLSAQPSDYRIGTDDVLDVVVWNNTALSRTVPVRPDGQISLALINDIKVAGLTPMELREELVRRLGRYMQAPEVSVIVREVHSFKASIVGQVKAPGRYDLKGRTTVLDLLATAASVSGVVSPPPRLALRPDSLRPCRI